MDGINHAELRAIQARLELAIDAIVDRHRSAGDALTWRLLHDIEEEAFQQIMAAGDLDSKHVRMLESAPLFTYPRTEDPVNFGESNALPAAFFLIQQAYSRTH